MSMFKTALLLGGVPVRPSTKKERYRKETVKLLKQQNALIRAQQRQQQQQRPR